MVKWPSGASLLKWATHYGGEVVIRWLRVALLVKRAKQLGGDSEVVIRWLRLASPGEKGDAVTKMVKWSLGG